VSTLRDQQREETQTRVLDAAHRLFVERGFEAVTVRDIAVASGVSVGSVMAAGDKEALLVRVFDGLIERQHAEPPAARGDGESCIDRMLDLVRPFVTLFTGHPQLSRVYAAIQVSGKQPSPLFTHLAELLIDEIGTLVVRATTASPEDAAARARAAYFAYIGTLFSMSSRETIDAPEVLDSLRSSFSVICANVEVA